MRANKRGSVFCEAAACTVDPQDEDAALATASFLADMKGAEFRIYVDPETQERYVSGDLCWQALQDAGLYCDRTCVPVD